ncbi:MAG: UDP-3-O-(3-hydroxymyristoyl)glucosamine N-acyltransferase [Burkholderiales bacterium]|nr:MAG: UDP-3-O-(3-hydroxymyristoyl)glucosamine N-acyltransferase [Burkholderiales bacterium]
MAAGYRVDTLAEAVRRAAGERLRFSVHGDPARRIRGVAPLHEAAGDQLSFLANPRYRSAAAASAAGAIVLTAADRKAVFAEAAARAPTLVECGNPYAWFALAAQLLAPAAAPAPAISAAAHVAADAEVDATARVDAGAVVESGAAVGPRCWIGAGGFVGAGARLGADTRLHPGARVLAGCVVGARAIVHSGAVIGADGFGFAPLDGRWIKIPQTGRVVIGDDVEIGANTTIDRGAMGDTVIEDGVKLDNLIQVGHNCRIGAHSVLAGCVGIAGSASIGRGCQIGGAAMIAGHLSIADGTLIGPGTLVSRTIATAGHYTGFFPLMASRDWERNAAALRHLQELRARVRALEARLKRDGAEEQ